MVKCKCKRRREERRSRVRGEEGGRRRGEDEAGEEGREEDARVQLAAPFVSVHSSRDLSPWDGAIHIQGGSFLLAKRLWKYPHRHSQRRFYY